MTPTQNYDALLERITTWAIQTECGKGKMPTTPAQQLAVRIALERALQKKIFSLSFHPKQDWFMRVKGAIVAAITGNRWGKSTGMIATLTVPTLGCVPWAPRDMQDELYPIYSKVAMKYLGAPIKVVLAGPDFSNWLPLVVIPKLKDMIPWDALVTGVSRVQGQIIDGIEWWNGTVWKILSYKQEKDRFESWDAHIIGWDEPMPRSYFIAASRGAIDHNACHVMSFTPEDVTEVWSYDAIYLAGHHIQNEQDYLEAVEKKPSIVVVKGSMTENPFLDPESIKTQVSFWTDPDEREARIHGNYRFLTGAVYKAFSRDKHVRRIEDILPKDMTPAEQWAWFDALPKGVSCDPAGRKPWFMLWWMVTPIGELIFLDNWPTTDFYMTPADKLGVDRYAEIIHRIEAGDNQLGHPLQNVVYRILDPNAGRTPSFESGLTLQDLIERQGYYFDTTVRDDVEERHMLVTNRLLNGTVGFLSHCDNTIMAMERYVHREYRDAGPMRKDERAREEYKDGADCVGYTVVFDPPYFSGGYEPPRPIENMGL